MSKAVGKEGLPLGWMRCRLGDILTILNGRAYKKHEMLDQGTPILRIQNLNGGENWFYSDIDLPENKYCEKGDLLYAWSATFGPYWSRWEEKLIYHYHIWKVLPSQAIDRNFAFYELWRITEDLKLSAHGVAMPHITKGGMEDWEIVVPPLIEQTRIANKLDELLAQVDAIKARVDAIPGILKRFRQSVLAAAVRGRLTEEWREAESVDISEWKKMTVGDVAIVATGKTPKRGNESFWEDGDIPWITSALTGGDYCSAAEQYITKRAVEECSLKVFSAGTLLMAMYGEGKTRGQVTELKINATCNQACAAIVVDEEVALNEFVKLRFEENYEETRKVAVGGAQPNLNLRKVREIGINLPTLDEQAAIVDVVARLRLFETQVESMVDVARKRVNGLTQSVLAKAFRGELVPQNTDDEPASVLLERVRGGQGKGSL